ncbi:MAG: hypothetical protein OXQ86_09705 [Gammaproteobacteria bacterium]|nr:hypothetical protein [Gammaproteobacteria bacterium]MDE0412765.1 hypothetical protein [Gammaproteobacteria bacterium]
MRIMSEHLDDGLDRLKTPSFYEPVKNAECAEWYIARLTPGGWTVGLYVPKGFEAYVRIPHPRWKQVPQPAPGAIFYHGSWRRPVPFDTDQQAHVADVGQLIGPWADVLFETLGEVSSSFDERCICGLWEGYNVDRPATARFEIGMSLGFLLYRASRNAIAQSLSAHRMPCPTNVPSMIWPEDRSWCVITPFQFFSTYLAGPQKLIDRLLDRRNEIDVRVVHLDDELIKIIGGRMYGQA